MKKIVIYLTIFTIFAGIIYYIFPTNQHSDNKLEKKIYKDIGKPFVQMGHNDGVGSVAISPDGKFLVTGSEDETAKLWDIQTGKEIQTFGGKDDEVEYVAISTDEKYAMTIVDGNYEKFWDIKTGEEIENGKLIQTFKGHSDGVGSVAISSDGKILACKAIDYTIELIDIQDNKYQPLKGDSSMVESVAISPDDKYLVTGSLHNTAKLWDIKTGKLIRTFNSSMVKSVAISPDGKFLVTGSWDKTVKLWNIKTGKEIRTFKGHEEGVESVAISSDGKYLVTGSWDKTAKLWDIQTGKLIRTFKGHSPIAFVYLTSNSKFLATISSEISSFWNIQNKKVIKTFMKNIEVSEIFKTDKYLVTKSYKDTVKLWNSQNGEEIQTLKKYSGEITALAISPDGKFLVTGRTDNTAKLWDIKTGKEIRTFKGHFQNITSMEISPDSKFLVTGSWDRSAIVWDIETGKEIRSFGSGINLTDYMDVDISPDGKFLLVETNNYPRLWDIQTGKLIRTFKDFISITSDWKFMLTSDNNISILWDMKTSKEIQTFKGLGIIDSSISISNDGKFLLVNEDDHAELWDIKTGKLIRTFNNSHISSTTLTNDGKLLITGNSDGTTIFWDITTGKEIAQFILFTDGEWVIITPKGYFNSSLNGYKHLNILTDPMSVSDIGIFYEVFYRPDIVKAKLEGKDITKMVGNMTFQKALENPPPKISIGVSDVSTNKKEITIPYTVTSSGGGISEVRIFQNGKLVHGDGYYKNILGYRLTDTKEIGTVQKDKKGGNTEVMSPVSKIAEEKSSPYTNSITIPLIAGEKNDISIIAFNKTNTVQSNPATVSITSTLPKEKAKLWVLGVGLDRYKHELPLHYAVKDVQDFVCLYAGYGKECKAKGNAKSIFGENIEVKAYLTDKNATKANILKALNSIAQKAQPQDSFVWFQSGHGELDADGNYHIITFDTKHTKVNNKNMIHNTLNSNDLLDISKSIKAMSQLIVLDTCHAGGLDGTMSGLYDGRMSKLIRNMGIHLYAAAEAEQTAEETKENKHGTFTTFLLDGLKNSMPDKNMDSKISIIELGQYAVAKTIEHEAKKRNENERQTPIMRNFGEDRVLYKKLKVTSKAMKSVLLKKF
jgi:WD40 repeat protein/uncharacterized caspase-like protein